MKHQIQLFKVLAITFLFLSVMQVNAQKKVKFGKVSIEELKMTQYEKDTTAEAVILYNKGELNGSTLDFYRHYRVKILKKSGYGWANLVVDVPSQSSVSGFTYNLENGEVVKTKLKNESIYQEEITDDFSILRVFMPDVKVGSIIEIKYSHFLPPFEWRFQDEIPVVYSELKLNPNQYIKFSKNMFGYEPLAEATQYSWIAKDMPAIKGEPYINSLDNFITKMEIDIRNINIPGRYYKDYASDWNSIYKTLHESESFGKEIERPGYLKSEAQEIAAKYSDPVDQLKAAHAFIKENIKWNGKSRLYASEDLPGIFKKEKIGNSADINLSLISMLRKLDMNVQPIVLSTVDNGLLSMVQPSFNKLNYVIGYVKIGDQEYFLDATDPNLPMGILPERCLNGNARLISENYNTWKDLTPKDCMDKEVIQAEIQIDESGKITGTLNRKLEQYAALHFRNKMSEANDEESYLEELEELHFGLNVEDYKVTNLSDDLADAAKQSFELDITDMADDLGGTIAFSPLFFNVDYDNPFKSLERVYPVYFSQPIEKTSVVKVKIPEGYTFMDLPKPTNVRLPENGGRFLFTVSKLNDQEIQIVSKLELDKTVFLPDEYPYLQKLYSIIIDKMSQQLLIKSKT